MHRARLAALVLAPLIAFGCGHSVHVGTGAQTATAAASDGTFQQSLALSAYDSRAPLALRTSRSWAATGVRINEVTYQSPKGGRVPAEVVVPQGRGPFAGLILQHGLPGSSRDMLSLAEELARTGAVVVAVDAPFARPAHVGPGPVTFTSRDRTEQIQLIVDLRRAVDLLRSRPDVDPSRIAYLGYSYGGAMGGLLAGVEHRIRAYVLDAGDGGLVEHFAGSPELAQLYYSAASRPKSIDWYDSGHALPEFALCDAARWLQAKVGIEARNLQTCGG